eukprot:Blabericola_migrator_1__7916@NODE_4055_length_1356_cov_29_989139_g2503_i0_p1_GENE_NODE_4055_length_1356_cov_29_989139_g2503_i0NODE_4055_length_1356_cov_29_989139_g2503_i0_p1_ORF_typecomplete_len117_score7_26_NODE_4055_length_1356_cov_29_989139_g2503_i07631113
MSVFLSPWQRWLKTIESTVGGQDLPWEWRCGPAVQLARPPPPSSRILDGGLAYSVTASGPTPLIRLWVTALKTAHWCRLWTFLQQPVSSAQGTPSHITETVDPKAMSARYRPPPRT